MCFQPARRARVGLRTFVFALAACLSLVSPCGAQQEPSFAVLQLRVLEGEGGVHTAGTRTPRLLTLQATDETGRPLPGTTISIHLPSEGPSGLFSNGLRTEAVTTGPDGRASIGNVRWDRTGGPLTIRVTAIKDHARAGVLSLQYVTDNAPGMLPRDVATPTPAPTPPARTVASTPANVPAPSPVETPASLPERGPEREPARVPLPAPAAAPASPISKPTIATVPEPQEPRWQPSRSRKWLWISLAAAGAVGGVFAAGGFGGSQGGGAASVGAITAPTAPQIGTPTITIGKP